MATRIAAGLVVALTVTGAAAGAQPAEALPGERARVTLAPAGAPAQARLVGTLAGLGPDELRLRLADGRPAAVAVEDVRRFERGRGSASRWKRGLKGAAIGAAAALTATLSWWALSDDPEKDLGLGYGLFLYTPAAAGLGLSIGLALPPAERWETAAPAASGRAARLARPAPRGLQLSVRF